MANSWRRLFCVFIVCLLACFIFIYPSISAESANSETPLNQYGIRSTNPYVVDRFIVNGKTIDKIIVPGSPHPPIGFVQSRAANPPVPNIAAGTNTLTYVPAMEWVFGCSATSAAMMFGHYDNVGYDNMYAGPTNGGVFPMTNAVWGYHDFSNGDGPMALCPLSATRNGLDGRVIKGHVDDYWIKIDNAGPDPYITGPWTEHTQGECTGDFMGTNQSKYGSVDGATWFYNNSDGSPLYDFTDLEPSVRDGCHGLKLFVESRGYTVRYNGNFSQYILGSSSCSPSPCTNGFTYADFKAEIDAGRPVLIQVAGHTMLGFGYNDPSTLYIHDTWDYLDHSMTWDGTYSGLQHYGVTVLRLTSLSLADMSIAILGSPSSVIIGNNVTYTITVTNNGPNSATNAIVIDALPTGAIYVSATPNQGSCSGTSTVACNLGTINNSAQATVTLVLAPTLGGTLSNTAIVTSDLTDNTPADNTATAASITVNNPVPAISSISPSSATAGGTAFTLTVNGSNFSGDSTVYWGGAARTTTFVSFTQLTAAISAADIATAGTPSVTVVNIAPGGGTSNSSTFTINAVAPAAEKTSGNMCFIATAAFGSPLESHVQILRDFRDRVLQNSAAGKAFVQFYYQTSPPIADKIVQSEGLRLITRVMLMPVIGVAYLILHLGMFMTMLLFTVTLLTVILTIVILRKKIRKSAGAKAAA